MCSLQNSRQQQAHGMVSLLLQRCCCMPHNNAVPLAACLRPPQCALQVRGRPEQAQRPLPAKILAGVE